VTDEYQLLGCDAVALVRTDVSEECIASIIRVKNHRSRNNVKNNCGVFPRSVF
jgi:hypothetical protein